MNCIPFIVMAFPSHWAVTDLLNECGISPLDGPLNQPVDIKPICVRLDARHHLLHFRCPQRTSRRRFIRPKAFVGTPKELPPLFSPSHYGASRQAEYKQTFRARVSPT